MRVRKRKGAEAYLASYPQFVVMNPKEYQGRWSARFGNRQPIHIEVGSGKGRFITEMAKCHPEINYIGIDVQMSVLSHVLDKVLAENLPNVQLLHVDGRELLDYFSEGEVALIYLNFSDPWPKARHEKRRLTSPAFLKTYEVLVGSQGELHFKTDNRELFEYSLASFSSYGMVLQQVWLDLHASDFSENVMTEYEEKFSSLGQVIYRTEVKFR